MNADEKKWALGLIKDLGKLTSKLLNDERATASYWNGDDWGSASGYTEAEEWISNQLAKYVCDRARPLEK